MNESEANTILEQELLRFRKMSYAELLALVDCTEVLERSSPSGVIYQIEMQVFFDDEAKSNLRVSGAIDDGGWRAFKPLCEDFIIGPDGSFIGE